MPYPILHDENVQTKYGPTVVLSLKDTAVQLIRVFLPRRNGIVFTPTDIHCVNENTVAYALKYKGTCLKTRAFMLDIVTRAADSVQQNEAVAEAAGLAGDAV
jgi:hypothetical protein